MNTYTQQQILDAFRGATRSEIKKVSFPLDFDEVDFDRLEYFGWQDRKIPRRAYLATEHDGQLVALILNRAEAKPSRRTMCAWCRDVELTEEAVLYTVRRTGAKGRRGDTIGTLVCSGFNCAKHARKLPPAYHKGTDLAAIRADQLAQLRRRVDAFVTEVLSTED
ncbi:MAG: FBP domain-containing protein [Gordonia sp. (in: high G+C Gram-positive bacteria)]|uniref:FBP domain-containing protein n=1 Tax=Gordonia TaxID=2053 RepID=UPI003266FFE5